MREKLIELARILKKKPEIKERLERLTFGCWVKMFDSTIHWVDSDFWRYICVDQHFLYQDNPEWSLFQPDKWSDYIIIGHEPAYHDVLEYLGNEDYYLNEDSISEFKEYNIWERTYWIIPIIFLSPWPLSDQSDETLTQIISLCKNVWQNK